MPAAFLRKYGVPVSGTSVISVPLIKAGVTNYAVSADWTPVAGDVVTSRDGGTSWSNISNLPIARTAGNAAVWDFMLIGTETQAAQTRIMISDAATKAVEDDYFIVEFFGNISGIHSIDYSTICQDSFGFLYTDIGAVSGTRIQSPNTPGMQRADLTMINGVTVNTNTAQLGVNIVNWSGVALGSPLVPGYPLVDVKYILGTQSSGIGGFVGVDWGNIAQKSSTVNLNNTAISGISHYSGNTPQTGDSYLRIGNGGINLTSIAASSVIGNIAGNVNGDILGYVNISGIQSVVASGLANTILSQSTKCTELTAPSGSLTELILQSLNSSVSSSTMTISRSDNSTFGTRNLTLTPGASPIRGVN